MGTTRYDKYGFKYCIKIYKGDYMKGSINDLLWPIIVILSIIYLLVIEIKKRIAIRELKSKIKYTESQIVDMQIINKGFSEGLFSSIGGSILPSKLPDTYIVELKYEDSNYEINDEEIYKFYEIGDFVKLKLVSNLDESKNLISYELYNLNEN